MTEGSDQPLATLRAGGSFASALSMELLGELDSSALGAFLAASRWFGGKGSTPHSVRITDVVPVEWSDAHDAHAASAVVRLAVHSSDGSETGYQLPLVVREDAGWSDNVQRPPANAILARVDSTGRSGIIYDALHDAAFRSRLAGALEHGASFEANGARWTVTPIGGGAPGLGSVESRLASAEQSNSSVIFGDRAILKLFRKLAPGINPDVEVTRFLTVRTTYRDTPELLAEVSFESADGEKSVAGMLTRLVHGAEDGWSYALHDIASFLGARGNGGVPSDGFAGDARRLGEVTRELHAALASASDDPAFAVEPVSGDDISRWTARTLATIDSALDLLAAHATALDQKTAAMARAIAGRRSAIHELLDEASHGARGERAAEQGIKSRTHGDYHLGQLLHAPDGRWYVIDFEGEPARPIPERRELASPARDVAGMLRSFGYAAATGASRAGGVGTNPATEIRSAHWERDARAAFLEGYGADANDPLVELFEMEKMFYELAYELNNRPDWVWVPLRAIARLF